MLDCQVLLIGNFINNQYFKVMYIAKKKFDILLINFLGDKDDMKY